MCDDDDAGFKVYDVDICDEDEEGLQIMIMTLMTLMMTVYRS